MKHDCATEDRKLAIDRPCSACSEDPNMERHDHCPPFREPVASPQATRPDEEVRCVCGHSKSDHPENNRRGDGYCINCRCGEFLRPDDAKFIHYLEKRPMSEWSVEDLQKYNKLTGQDDLAAQPAAGTTPQAERPKPIEAIRNALSKLESQICRNPDLPVAYRRICNDGFDAIQHLEFVTNNFCEKHLEVALCSTGPCVMCRAVAPVETPQNCVDGKLFTDSTEKDCPTCVETRLTAEQFYDSQDNFNFFPDESRGIGAIWAFAEAFRDKSEALNWKRQESCSECDDDGCAKCCRGCAGLREEIERLRREGKQ